MSIFLIGVSIVEKMDFPDNSFLTTKCNLLYQKKCYGQ